MTVKCHDMVSEFIGSDCWSLWSLTLMQMVVRIKNSLKIWDIMILPLIFDSLWETFKSRVTKEIYLSVHHLPMGTVTSFLGEPGRRLNGDSCGDLSSFRSIHCAYVWSSLGGSTASSNIPLQWQWQWKMFYLTINTCMYITYYILENVNINRSGDYY